MGLTINPHSLNNSEQLEGDIPKHALHIIITNITIYEWYIDNMY